MADDIKENTLVHLSDLQLQAHWFLLQTLNRDVSFEKLRNVLKQLLCSFYQPNQQKTNTGKEKSHFKWE